MKCAVPKTAGGARTSVRNGMKGLAARFLLISLLLAIAVPSQAQSMYKYRGENGEWIFSDRPPDDGSLTEVRNLVRGSQPGEIEVVYGFQGETVQLTANNKFHAPIELELDILSIRGIDYPDPDMELRWVLPPRSSTPLLSLPLLLTGAAPKLEYQYRYIPGDPTAQHRPPVPYRAPFAAATSFPVTQAYPEVATHTTPDSYHAVDLAMPIGTDIFAARDGIVFDVASTHFSAGLDPARDGPNANVVRILHDDGTYAIYAHLNTNSIRVRPGDRVRRGEYIADSGNTGYSSGPHLHFVVLRNAGLRAESLPVAFEGQNSSIVLPASGKPLTAY